MEVAPSPKPHDQALTVPSLPVEASVKVTDQVRAAVAKGSGRGLVQVIHRDGERLIIGIISTVSNEVTGSIPVSPTS